MAKVLLPAPSGSRFSALLTVTTDPGATVTATSASSGKTYTGIADENGLCVLKIRAAGTYTITMTLNGVSVVKTVVVADTDTNYTESGYQAPYLYEYGDEHEDVTGGWIPWKAGTLNTHIFKEEEGIRFYSTGSANIAPLNRIDLTDYTSITAEVTDSNTRWFCLGATQDDADYFNSGTWSGNWPTTTPHTILDNPGAGDPTNSFTISLDVSACSGLWRIVLASRGYNSELGATLRTVKLSR